MIVSVRVARLREGSLLLQESGRGQGATDIHTTSMGPHHIHVSTPHSHITFRLASLLSAAIGGDRSRASITVLPRFRRRSSQAM